MAITYTSLVRAAEESIADYIVASASYDSGSANPVNFYLGTTYGMVSGSFDEMDIQAPAVFIKCESGNETYYNSGVYDLDVSIEIKEMAADTEFSNVGVLALNIFNVLSDPNRAQYISRNNWNFACYQVQNSSPHYAASGDATVYSHYYKVIGCLAGS